MARTSRRMLALPLLLLSAPLAVHAQLSSVPDLSTAQTSVQTTAQTTDPSTQAKTTQDSKTPAQTLSNAPQLTSASSRAGNTFAATGSLTQDPVHLTGLPTIAGAGIPTLVIPYTANAPYMKKSSLPEGTFFIAVGATLAFLGACVLLWRGLVAWSINRGVKRTALASMQHSEKPRSSSYWGGSTNHGYNRVSNSGGKGSLYKDLGGYSNVSLDNLTSAGKPIKPHFRESVSERNTSSNAPPPNLFFSPTAQAAHQRDSYRSSGYMPSGYYASPNSQAAGGNTSTTIGTGGLAPGYTNTQRHSTALSSGPSPPPSPGLPPQSRGSGTTYRNTLSSRDGLRGPTREGPNSARNSTYLYDQPSSSSLMVGGASTSDLPGSRTPSAYLEDVFENHGHGPRERF